MYTPTPTPDPTSTLHETAAKHRARADQARGVAALAGCFAVMILIIWGVASIAQAQSASDSLALGPTPATAASESAVEGEETAVRFPVSAAAWRNNIGKQSAIALRMPGTAAKEQTLRNLILFANRYGEALDLSDAVPMVVHVYAHNRNEDLRTMALAALHAIGDAKGMERVLRLFADPLFRHRLSPRLRHITHAALAEYIASGRR